MSRLDGFRTLMLDSAFRPLRTIPWQRAVVLDLQDRVDAIEYYDEVVRTPSTVFPLPAVVRLRQYLRLARPGVSFSRRNVLLRDAFQCQYCGCRPPIRELTMDHVLPRSRGGGTTWDNVVTACRRCNVRKGNRTPREARMTLATHPRRPLCLPLQRTTLTGEDLPPEWVDYLDLAG